MADRKDFPAPSQPLDSVARIAALSPRCRDVLNGIMAGHPSKVIADLLGISPRTVEIHRARLKRQLGVRNTADAIRIAYEARYAPKLAHRGGKKQGLDKEPQGPG